MILSRTPHSSRPPLYRNRLYGTLCAAALTLTACETSDSTAATSTDAASTDASATLAEDGASGDSEASPPDPATLHACQENVGEFQPLKSARYDKAQGGLIGQRQAQYVVHTTRLFVKPEKEHEFLALAGDIIKEFTPMEGMVAFALGGSACGDSRTLGIWESEEALYKAIASPAHVRAMGATLDISFTGKTTHWLATPEEVDALTWDVANEKLAAVPASGIYPAPLGE